ncbi:hypothetical protein GCM10009818_15010 [Nakamurella flavida]
MRAETRRGADGDGDGVVLSGLLELLMPDIVACLPVLRGGDRAPSGSDRVGAWATRSGEPEGAGVDGRTAGRRSAAGPRRWSGGRGVPYTDALGCAAACPDPRSGRSRRHPALLFLVTGSSQGEESRGRVPRVGRSSGIDQGA